MIKGELNEKITYSFCNNVNYIYRNIFLPIEDYKLYHWNGITYREMIIPFSNKKIKIKFTGKSLTYHFGTLTGMKRETFYKFGKKHGKSTFYNKYPNSIASVTPYKDGKIDGIERVCYADGSLKYEIEYRNRHLCGSWKNIMVMEKLLLIVQ